MTTPLPKPLSIEERVEQLHYVINGNPHIDTPGLRTRVKSIEDYITEDHKTKIRNRWIMYGIGIGFGLAQASILGILIQVLNVLSGTGLP